MVITIENKSHVLSISIWCSRFGQCHLCSPARQYSRPHSRSNRAQFQMDHTSRQKQIMGYQKLTGIVHVVHVVHPQWCQVNQQHRCCWLVTSTSADSLLMYSETNCVFLDKYYVFWVTRFSKKQQKYKWNFDFDALGQWSYITYNISTGLYDKTST